MKRYEFLIMERNYYGGKTKELVIKSTTPEPLHWIKEEAVKIGLVGKKGQIRESNLWTSGEQYYLSFWQQHDEMAHECHP